MSLRKALGYLALVVALWTVPVAAMTLTPPDSVHVQTLSARAEQGGQRIFTGTAESAPAVTIRSQVRFQKDWQGEHTQEIRLAGVATKSGTLPDRLALAWVQDRSGWFIVWALRLVSDDAAMFPASMQPSVSRGPSGTLYSVQLAQITPLAGHTYQAALSYDGATGALSVALSDLTASEASAAGNAGPHNVAGTFRVGTTTQPLVPAADIASDTGVPQQLQVTLDAATALDAFVPVGTEWKVAVRSANAYVTQARYLRTDHPGIRLQVGDVPLAGSYRVVAQQGGHTVTLLDVPKPVGDLWLPLPAAKLPIGRSTLTLEYVKDDHVWLTDSTPIDVGHLALRFAPIVNNRTGGRLTGAIDLTSDGPIPGPHVRATATLTRLDWNAANRRFDQTGAFDVQVLDRDVDLAQNGTHVPIALALPDPGSPGLWQVAFKVDVTPGVQLDVLGTAQLFTTYEPAGDVSNRPFTLALLPDTEYYTRDDPQMFLRQTQWLAAHARGLNLGAVLQVGNTTADNTDAQWQNAKAAVSVLDGIAPYVPSAGNHDMGAQGDVKSRDATRIDAYFPPENDEINAFLGGTFRPGRVENSYRLFTWGGQKFLVLSLEFGPSDAALAWANNVVAKYPDRRVIVVTAAFTAQDGALLTPQTSAAAPEVYPYARNPGESVNDGQQIWDRLVGRHPNISMVLSGHGAHAGIARRVQRGTAGNPVFELQMDYAFQPFGGDGRLVLMTFDPDGTVAVRTYSPYTAASVKGVDAFGFDNAFSLDLKQGTLGPPLTGTAKNG